ncbi:MAG: cupin domain-containing protein [Flavobacteriaceae bacterium]|nr:cupin domain-containing protein [Flavobacteriaceae bacterium]
MNIDIENIKPKEIVKGYHGRFIHMENFTYAYWEVEARAEIPMHSHVHEQMMQVLEGEFELTVNGKTKVYKPGTIVTIPSHVKHGGKAITYCKLTDIFCPVREDYQ